MGFWNGVLAAVVLARCAGAEIQEDKEVKDADGGMVRTRKMKLKVNDIGWLDSTTLLYAFNEDEYTPNTNQHVLRQLNPFTGEDTEVYRAPRDRAIFNFTISPTGKQVGIREQVAPNWTSGLFLVNLASGGKREAQGIKGMGLDPYDFFWWPDGRHLYFETP